MRGTTLQARTVHLARAMAEGVSVMPDALDLLDLAVGADTLSVSALQLGVPSNARAEVFLRGTEPMRVEEMDLWARLMATHPYLPRLANGPMATSRVTDVVDMRVFERSELFERLLEPRGSRFQAALVLERSPDSMLLLSLWRARRDFTDDEIELLEAFRSLMAAAAAFSKAVDVACRADLPPSTPGAGRNPAGVAQGPVLTRRQRQVAVLVEGGMTNDQIARRLGISARTVRKHVSDLFEQTGARTRTQVALWWRQGESRTTDSG